MRLWSKFVSLSAPERFLLLRALFAVAGFRLALGMVPFPRLRKYLESVSPRAVKSPVSPAQIGRAVGRASRVVARSTCLVQALAAQWLLRHQNHVSQLHVGVIKGENGQLLAHAWVECDGEIVVGGGGSSRYTPILRWENG